MAKRKIHHHKKSVHHKKIKKIGKLPVLEFYDLKKRKSFKTNVYSFKTKKGRKFAIAKAPSGIPSWRILGKA